MCGRLKDLDESKDIQNAVHRKLFLPYETSFRITTYFIYLYTNVRATASLTVCILKFITDIKSRLKSEQLY